MIGSRGVNWIKSRDYNVCDQLIDMNEDDAYDKLSSKVVEALDLFERKEISKIQILYTHYKIH